MKTDYDIIVIGGGHAGCEASLAAARLGCRTLMVTMDVETIGLISCNPAIGGLAKGQLVKEIDALGGQMAKTTDHAGIQFRTLNTKKGPAVRSSRVQVDRQAYRFHIKAVVEIQQGLDIKQGMVEEIVAKNGSVVAIRTDLGQLYRTRAVIVTTGTFLGGLIHIGLESSSGGRMGEKSSEALARSLKDLGLKMGRLKTGTCARLDGRTIDLNRLSRQEGDDEITPLSFETINITRKQLSCYITYTNKKTHEIIRSNLDRSPLFTGIIKGTGVRYCPSIEDKIYRFPERDRHHIFLEPEGLNTVEYYPNGISTSLPVDVQEELIHSIEGLENARITRPGYGIEYDYADPTQLYPTLEVKHISGLYLAGQINGTTGYEEAASLGLMAGLNAALKIKGSSPLILERSQAYIGVLIDDLVTKGTNEPYRMFTSRVENRLILREDNADTRLVPIGHAVGLVDENRYLCTTAKKERVEQEIVRLRQSQQDKILRRPGVSYHEAVTKKAANALSEAEIKEVEIEVKYEGFIKRQMNQAARLLNIERIKIPDGLDYNKVHSLSSEIKEKLSKIRPVNLGQASRISGVTPAAVSILMIWFEKLRKSQIAQLANTGNVRLYNDYNSYLKAKYGCKVYRIGLDAGFSCPNRDGTRGTGGCIYCNQRGSRSPYVNTEDDLNKQLGGRIDYLKKKQGAEKFIAYFQAFTNTYAPADRLKNIYDSVLPYKEIVGISIGTRPDTIDSEKLRLIHSYRDRYEVWLEYGLQSIHDTTLRYIERGHDYDDFRKAVTMTKEFGLPVCAHIILGLPGESREDMANTAIALSSLKIDAVKIHLLHVLRGSRLEKLYEEGRINIMGQDEYADIVCDFLEYLRPDIIIQRLTGEGVREEHIAPVWALNKIETINKIVERLKRRGSYQGMKYGAPPISQSRL